MAIGSAGSGSALARWATAGISVLNGFWGDYLARQGNALAVDMAFYENDRPLALTGNGIRHAHPTATAKLCVLVHGLSCSEHIWLPPAPSKPADAGEYSTARDYGARLQADYGYTPFYVRYNSGRAIADNGQALAALLAELCAAYPEPVTDIILIGHSMGGLVLRHACAAAGAQQMDWVGQVRRIFYLGTPHEGANLARAAHHAADVLHAVPNAITRLVGDVLDLRSEGIKGLRAGMGAEELPWLAHAQHYLIEGVWHTDPAHPIASLFGDGLVHPQRAGSALPPGHVRLLAGMHHMQLAHDDAVYAQIAAWLAVKE